MGVREEREAQMIEWKSKPCTDCGGFFPFYCMDFDHVPERGDKCFEVNMNSGVRRPLEEVLAEMEKCDLVCAICHRIRTQERKFTGGAKHKTECVNGHDLTDPKNQLIVNGKRKGCSECRRLRASVYYYGEKHEEIKAKNRQEWARRKDMKSA